MWFPVNLCSIRSYLSKHNYHDCVEYVKYFKQVGNELSSETV